MDYFSYRPSAPLSRFVQLLWYTRTPQLDHRHQRVLPTGNAQIILNLARDYLLDFSEDMTERRTAPALIAGQRSCYEIIDTSDLAELIGVVFAPGALAMLAGDRADLFSNRSVNLVDVWGGEAKDLHARLLQLRSPQERLRHLELFLLSRFALYAGEAKFELHPAVEFALHRFGSSAGVATVREVARATGWSDRRFSQIFREHVGFAPKTWCRLTRFQRALHQLHAGVPISWAEVAAECGFYDQAHCANEFRNFSGIDIRTYRSHRDPLWANHVRAS